MERSRNATTPHSFSSGFRPDSRGELVAGANFPHAAARRFANQHRSDFCNFIFMAIFLILDQCRGFSNAVAKHEIARGRRSERLGGKTVERAYGYTDADLRRGGEPLFCRNRGNVSIAERVPREKEL